MIHIYFTHRSDNTLNDIFNWALKNYGMNFELRGRKPKWGWLERTMNFGNKSIIGIKLPDWEDATTFKLKFNVGIIDIFETLEVVND